MRAVITVLLVDDHAVVRQGLRAFFDVLPDIEVVAEADDGATALRELALLTAAGSPPDVVVMDLLMPEIDGDEAIRRMLAQDPHVRVLVLTSFREPERVRAALAAGAAGYLLKDARADEVAAAVRATHAGELHLDPAVARELGSHLLSPQRRGVELTGREREVLVRVAQGLTNQQIATTLRISERTARTHVSNILAKLGLTSRTQAAAWAIRQGMVGSS